MRNFLKALIVSIMLLVVLLSITTFEAKSQSADEIFIEANNAYDDGRYGDAVIAYESILEQGTATPELYYNLGNAYYRMDNLPYAILNYERANKLSPGDTDIQHNLSLASAKTVDRIEPIPQFFVLELFDNWIEDFGSGFWSAITVLSLWILAVMVYLLILGRSKRLRKVGLFGSTIMILLFFVSFSLAWQADTVESTQNDAIIMAPSAYVRSEPSGDATELFILHEGTKAEILDLRSEYFYIRLADGNKGWIEQSLVEKI
jgi:tetratricopeptide (TPR) repeat protein